MADRFAQEALKRKSEVDIRSVKPYLRQVLSSMEKALKKEDKQKVAEDSLMFSTSSKTTLKSIWHKMLQGKIRIHIYK